MKCIRFRLEDFAKLIFIKLRIKGNKNLSFKITKVSICCVSVCIKCILLF